MAIRYAITAGLMLASVLVGAAVAPQPLLQPVSTPLADRFTQRVPVSGYTLVGVLRDRGPGLPPAAGLGDGTIAVAGPLDGAICVRVTTQDGRYSAENTFGAVGVRMGSEGGLVRLAWPSTQPKPLLDAIRLGELAVLALKGACGHGGAVLPATIGAAPAPGASLQVLANSRGAAIWAVLRDAEHGGPALRRVRCVRPETGDQVAFDVVCPLGPEPAGVSRLELRLEQRGRDGNSNEVVEKVALAVPDGSAADR